MQWYQVVCFMFLYMCQSESSVIAFLEKSIMPKKGTECVIIQGNWTCHPGSVWTAGYGKS